MSDLPERLRRLYVQTGMNYVQEAADEIEHLRAEVQRRREHIAVFDGRYTQLEAERDELRRQIDECSQMLARQAATIRDLESKLRSADAAERSINEALNSGDGSYRP